jgi:hypothetical protein
VEVFELPFAIMLFMGSMFKAAVVAFQWRSLGIAQVAGFLRQGPAGGADIGFLLHNSSSCTQYEQISVYKNNSGKGVVNSANHILTEGFQEQFRKGKSG